MTDKELTLKYKNAEKKLFLLDYDGTLVNYEIVPDNAKPTEKLADVLNSLNSLANLKLIIITGRDYQDIEKLIGHFPVDIIAEHGAFYRKNNKWSKTINTDVLWKKDLLSLFNRFNLACHDSFIEEKDFSIAWHYRNTEPEIGYAYSRILINLLLKFIDAYNLKLLDGNKVIEVMSKNIGKGIAIKRIIEQHDYDYILSIGDDITDEEMFNYLLFNENAVTIKVGNGGTAAKKRLDSVEEVINLLEKLSVLS
jgi:trehalose 6-phosphate synthase/phosphatase